MAENYKPYSLVKVRSKTTQETTDKEGKKKGKVVVTETSETATYYTERGLAQMAWDSKQEELDGKKDDKA